MKALFARDFGAVYIVPTLAVASLLVAFVDVTTRLLDPVRSGIGVATGAIYTLAGSPYALAAHVQRLSQRSGKVQELERRVLELSLLVQESRAERAENDRLRALLGSRPRIAEEVLVAELIAVTPNPRQHRIVIDKGLLDGVEVGQAVVDSSGLFGQVIEASPLSSVVLLITDSTHATPAEVHRNSLRTIAAGTGRYDALELEAVPQSADIREGDVLLSSGLGGRFPSGHAVGEVISVEKRSTARFARVTVRPKARLDRSRYVLVVRHKTAEDGSAAPPGAGAAS